MKKFLFILAVALATLFSAMVLPAAAQQKPAGPESPKVGISVPLKKAVTVVATAATAGYAAITTQRRVRDYKVRTEGFDMNAEGFLTWDGSPYNGTADSLAKLGAISSASVDPKGNLMMFSYCHKPKKFIYRQEDKVPGYVNFFSSTDDGYWKINTVVRRKPLNKRIDDISSVELRIDKVYPENSLIVIHGVKNSQSKILTYKVNTNDGKEMAWAR
ncbi:MAG: hypothetical protein WDN09_00595 [bacterium]